MPSSNLPLSSLLAALSKNPNIIEDILNVDGCLQFVELLHIMKPTLQLYQAESQGETKPLQSLPRNVHDFIRASLQLEHEHTKLLWEALRDVAWEIELEIKDLQSYAARYLQIFLNHGPARGIAFYHFLPPTRVCIDPRCSAKPRGGGELFQPRPLVEMLSVSITVFTQDFGPIPGLSTSLYCRECNTRYYPNYYVHTEASLRTYYHGPFEFLHIAEGVFIEGRTCEVFSNMMLFSWTSASNCARIYNDGLARSALNLILPPIPSKSLTLDIEDVWDSLMLYWLLTDCDEKGEVLELIHVAPSQAKRLRPALKTRNKQMEGPGQEAWNHACELCCWVDTKTDGTKTYLRSVVTDGVSIGRPACMKHDCMNTLNSVKDRYCPEHLMLNRLCVVTTCSSLAEENHRTCAISEHRKLEDYNAMQNKAMFQLKHRLARLKTSQPQSSFGDSDLIAPSEAQGSATLTNEEVLIDENGICDGKSASGNTTVRARFGRRRTHNEELCVASCGVILGRATFYGSEAPSSILEFWTGLFPTKNSLPQVLWYDNNCRIRVMLNSEKHPEHAEYFSHCALPVDVFHFKSKHKETDLICNQFCNPYSWEELRIVSDDGTEVWRFNSSAAEQSNAWIGGYQSIVREMQADRYDFFLDEMIKRRNRKTIRDLQRSGKAPYQIPREVLLRTNLDV